MRYDREEWGTCYQLFLLGLSCLITLSERITLLLCISYYVWSGRMLLAGLTFALALPCSAVQALSVKWHIADGGKHKPLLYLIHVLHMGILQRMWMCTPVRQQMRAGVVMQQADISALCLLEALLLSLPQTLLQSYILFTTDEGLLSPVSLCCGLCLLALCWALVLFSRACSLLRPGHLAMPPVALLFLLLWRVGMLGARVISLTFFSRMFPWWTFGVIGFHWLAATFWMVSQQTDICSSTPRWRVFNCILGAVLVFLFLNVKAGRSRYRMAGFYLVMLLENSILVLFASDVLSKASWEAMVVPTVVFCSFLIGVIAMVLYYRFLHPKSNEILQSWWLSRTLHKDAEITTTTGRTPPESSVHRHGTFSITGVGLSPTKHSCISEAQWDKENLHHLHHHSLLIRLALKTGDYNKIISAYGGTEGLAALLGLQNQLLSPAPDTECGLKQGDQPPLDEKRESLNGHMSPRQHTEDGEDEADFKSVLEPAATEIESESPEGCSVLQDSPVRIFFPAESGSTLYFSAEPATSPPPDGSKGEMPSESMARLSPICSGRELHWAAKEFLHREPCYTSTPKHKLNATPLHTEPQLGRARRQLDHISERQ